MRQLKTKQMVWNALLIAMYVALGYASLNFGNMVITMQGFPVIVGALLGGPVAGLEIGLIGSFINQLLKYGITATTVLWIIPAGVQGLIVGYYAKKKQFNLNRKQFGFIVILSAIVVTTINTVVIYLDSKIYGYYSYAYVFSVLGVRYLSSVLTALSYVVIMPPIMSALNKYFLLEKVSYPSNTNIVKNKTNGR